ncbi:MAG: ABC transporter ATP-binding protein [Deltaproteobacteria bacterium]|jgi:branched-chain amino acid transport system ATP-binding protein|nr:ABC transporter ATP-binding protein [Deltaproteobacteria bacterium]MBT4265238.1 ABC transporter ATP-binding protein [Deltaproteobacteria bacterium]MBT4639588.1 ABC transporter ATP-binding protein [Deltaproteobacteria bacterium]MBT6503979.1 ABC transporter ATP-binding protein [Deltaproteobacteria bacterium]MBT6616348.1 ABC transporter ATP-binding protein [Deltaproteobacteria bacterium]
MNILETKDLTFGYSGHNVLSSVNLEIREGERHAVIGPNGAGKTTLFNVITGTYKPDNGRIMLRGNDVSGLRPYQLNRLGMGRSFQITSTFAKQSVFQNVRMGILSKKGIRFNMLKRLSKMENITQQTLKTIEQSNLSEQKDVLAGLLSYGKNRALEICMAMSTDPDLVMLDEPTAGISKDETTVIVELVRSLTENKTMVIIEHDMDVVFSLADRITVLHHGEILACGTPSEIKNNPAVKDAYLGETEI